MARPGLNRLWGLSQRTRWPHGEASFNESVSRVSHRPSTARSPLSLSGPSSNRERGWGGHTQRQRTPPDKPSGLVHGHSPSGGARGKVLRRGDAKGSGRLQALAGTSKTLHGLDFAMLELFSMSVVHFHRGRDESQVSCHQAPARSCEHD